MFLTEKEADELIVALRDLRAQSLENYHEAIKASREFSKLKSENLRLTNEMLDLQIRYNDLCAAALDVLCENVELKGLL